LNRQNTTLPAILRLRVEQRPAAVTTFERFDRENKENLSPDVAW
jgi:hypothetical protein